MPVPVANWNSQELRVLHWWRVYEYFELQVLGVPKREFSTLRNSGWWSWGVKNQNICFTISDVLGTMINWKSHLPIKKHMCSHGKWKLSDISEIQMGLWSHVVFWFAEIILLINWPMNAKDVAKQPWDKSEEIKKMTKKRMFWMKNHWRVHRYSLLQDQVCKTFFQISVSTLMKAVTWSKS